IGARLNTNTEVILGVNKMISDRENELIKEKQELQVLLEKLKLLGKKIAAQDQTNPKIRMSLLRQRNSYKKTSNQLNDIEEELSQMNATIGKPDECKLIVRNFIYQNAIVTFGKYTRIMRADYHYVQMNTLGNEITLHQLY